jgi:hypothetical protein
MRTRTQQASSHKTGVIAPAAADFSVCAALRREHLADHSVWQILQEVEAGQHPAWKDIFDRSPIYTSYWAQWNSLVSRDGVLQ